jgi:hypothetical protein
MLARTLLIAAPLWLLPVTGFAQVSAAASAQAAELFDQGRALLSRQDFGSACPKFADSAKLEPKVGTLLNLADCEEHLGQIVSARGHWQDAANLARSAHDERAAVAQERFAALDPRVAKLAVTLEPGAPANVRVSRDGVELGQGSLGAELPVDPGTHTIVVSAAGYADRSFSVTLEDGVRQTLAVGPGAPVLATVPALPAPSSTWTARKTLAVVTAGAGVAGVVVGSVFGAIAISNNNGSNGSGCVSGTSTCTNGTAVDERNAAFRDGNVSTAAFIVGGFAVAAGAVLWFTAPRSAAASTAYEGPAIGIGAGRVLVEGTF